MENEIDANIDALSGAASRLNNLAKVTGQELDEQNRHLRRLNEKVCLQIGVQGCFLRMLTDI